MDLCDVNLDIGKVVRWGIVTKFLGIGGQNITLP